MPTAPPAYLTSPGSLRWPGRCAYCGEEGVDTKDHVVPRCIYPSGSTAREYVQVPSHFRCNNSFSRAETAFKEHLAAAGANEAAAKTRESVLRGFRLRPRRALDFLARLRNDCVYPLKSHETVLVLRKVVRGLAFYHGLFLALPPDLISVGFTKYEIPPAFLDCARFHEVGHEDVFEYRCFVMADQAPAPPDLKDVHSFWRLRFYDRVMFDAWVEMPPNDADRAEDW